MTDADFQELEKYRQEKKKKSEYINQYTRDNYARLVCLLPIEKKAAFDAARAGVPVSAFINRLIDDEIARRGLS